LKSREPIVVAGAGGFIGGHLVAELLRRGCAHVRAVDVKPVDDWYQLFPEADNLVLDLRDSDACRQAADGMATVLNFACDMGGMGFIENNKALCMLSSLINTHLLMAAVDSGVTSYMYASSACVYAADKQTSPDVTALKESDAYPAEPEDGYGWEKLFGERMCRHFMEDFGIAVRIPRFHNVYGAHGTWDGGREKAPAAVCRKVLEAQRDGTGAIEIWGDGKQTRSFTYIDDAVDGVFRLLDSDVAEPINIGSSELVTVDGLVSIVEGIAGVRLDRSYDVSAPQGVRGRNSDNAFIREQLGWEPSTPLEVGLAETYRWIAGQMGATAYEAPLAVAGSE
jgi:nucleoside-diphosphate-sugar epimerase